MQFQFSDVKRKDVPSIAVVMAQVSESKANAANAANATRDTKALVMSLNAARPFISIKRIAIQIAKLYPSGGFCLCINKLPATYKLVFLNYVSKQLYKFDKYITRTTATKPVFVHDASKSKSQIVEFLHALHCADFARMLQNEPANVLSPENFTNVVKHMFSQLKLKSKAKAAQKYKVKINIKNEKDMEKEGLNLILAIGLSSKRMPRFMTIEYIRDKSYPTICMVGKTVVYDAGGLNIKLGKSMGAEMKDDKAGGSVVVAVMKHFVEQDIKCNIVGILPIVENLLSEDVTRPGDIVKAYDGRTVEITNTDAEGRLIMADAIAYSKKFKPTYLFDLATLTGWSEAVHADISAVCYCRNMQLASTINGVGDKVGERVWFLPPWDEYTYYTRSEVADIRNFSLDMKEGAYLPSMFLVSFVPHDLRDRYVHFDICNNYQRNLAQGNCVVLMIELIKKLSM